MAYERLDIEVTDNGSSRRVQRSLEGIGASARQMADGTVRVLREGFTSVGAAAEAGANRGRRAYGSFSAELQRLQTQYSGLAMAGYGAMAILESKATATAARVAGIAVSARLAARGMGDLRLAGYGAMALLEARAGAATARVGGIAVSAHLATLGMGDLRMAGFAALAVIELRANAAAAALGRVGSSAAAAASAFGARAGGSLGSTPLQLTRIGTAAQGAAANLGGAARSAQGYMSSFLGSVRNGASSAASAVRSMFSNLGGGGMGGGGGAGNAANGAARGINNVNQAAKNASSALITMNTLMYSLQLGMIAVLGVKWADEWQSIENKLDLVTRSTAELTAVNDALFLSAQRTRTGYSDVVELFQGLRLQSENLGLSMRATAELTDTISMASQIGSKGPAQAAAGVLQLTQALALGRLSGQNLNSVLQSTPRIAMAIAQGLGKTTAELRAMADPSQKGGSKLGADQIVKGLQKAAPQIAAEFLKLKPTISSAFTVLNNAAINFMGNLEKSTGFATALSTTIIALANNMDILVTGVLAVAAALMVAFGGAVQRAIVATGIAIAANPLGAFIALVLATGAAMLLLKDRFDEYPGVLAGVAGAVAVVATLLAGPLVASFASATVGAISFAAALLMNPLTWIALGIGAAVAAIVYFGNKTTEVNGKVISGWSILRASAAGGWAAIQAGATALWQNLGAIFMNIATALGNLGQAFLSVMSGDFSGALDWGTKAFESAQANVGVFKDIGGAMGDAYTEAFNASVAKADAVKPGKKKGGKGWLESLLGLDDTPGKATPYASDADKNKGSKKAKTPEDVIADWVRKTKDETELANNPLYDFRNRDAYAAVDELDRSLSSKKNKDGSHWSGLSDDQRKRFVDMQLYLQKSKDAMKARDDVLRDAVEPQRQHALAQQAIVDLLKAEKISAEEAARAQLAARAAYLSTRQDSASGRELGAVQIAQTVADRAAPIASAMKNIWQAQQGPMQTYKAELEAVDELLKRQLITAQGAARATRDAAIAYYSTQRDAASGAMLGQLQIMEEMEDMAGPLAQAMKGIWQDQVGPMRSYQTQIEAIRQLEASRLITAQQASVASQRASLAYLDSQVDAASGFSRAMMRISMEAQDAASRVEQIFTGMFDGVEDLFVEVTRRSNRSDVQDGKSVSQVRKEKRSQALDTFQVNMEEQFLRNSFKTALGGPLADMLGPMFGVDTKGKLGESAGNAMWVRMAGKPGEQATEVVGGASALSDAIGSIFGRGKKSMPDFNDMMKGGWEFDGEQTFSGGADLWGGQSVPTVFGDFTEDLDKTFTTGAGAFGDKLVAGVGALGSVLGNLIGGKAGGAIGAIVSGGAQLFGALKGTGIVPGFATGGSFTVGGGGGVDSQLVQFRASPGERVSVARAGQEAMGGGGMGGDIHVHVDARGATDPEAVRRAAREAVAEAAPRIVQAARKGAKTDRDYEASRTKVGGKR